MAEVEVKKENLVVTEQSIQQLKTQYDMFRKLQQIVLEEGIDFGFPTPTHSKEAKPSLYKSGAEKLTRLFNLIPEFELVKCIETDTMIMYTFKCVLKTQAGSTVGEGYGACNTNEKQGWKANPWAFQNNILKMAKKRAHVDAVLTGLGASNVFTQDIEDIQEQEQKPQQQPQQQQTQQTQPQKKSQEHKVTDKQLKLINDLINQIAKATDTAVEEIVEEFTIKCGKPIEQLEVKEASNLIEELQQILQQVQQM